MAHTLDTFGEGVKNDPLKNLPMINTISTITSTTNKSQNKGDRLIPFEKEPPELLVEFGNWKECPVSGAKRFQMT